jgi:diaminopimelate decarboxylase
MRSSRFGARQAAEMANVSGITDSCLVARTRASTLTRPPRVAYHHANMQWPNTTGRLDGLIDRHRGLIERLIERFGLPLHVFFAEEMEGIARGFRDVLRSTYPKSVVAFAVKSNPCRGAVRVARRLGLGADVASEYELQAALEERIDPSTIVCNGNAKSAIYLDMALRAGAPIALDNEAEIELLEERARRQGAMAHVLVRFRGMPLSGLTSADQTTAADWTKFGFHIDEAGPLFSRIGSSDRLRFCGLSAHIGTQIADPIGYELLVAHLLCLADRAVELGLLVECIDIGGGFPVAFLTDGEWKRFTARLLARLRDESPISEAVTWDDLALGYAHVRIRDEPDPRWIGKSYWSALPASRMLAHILEHRFENGATTVDRLEALGRPRLIVEPGRSLMASAGITLAQATGVKTVLGHRVVSLDIGINNHGTNLISPDIFPAAVLPKRPGDRPVEAFLAGRLCFSGDMVSKAKIELNRLPTPGDRCVVYHTGAYSADHFASHSCGFPVPAKVAIRPDGTAELWRAPEAFADVFGAAGDELAIGGLGDA